MIGVLVIITGIVSMMVTAWLIIPVSKVNEKWCATIVIMWISILILVASVINLNYPGL